MLVCYAIKVVVMTSNVFSFQTQCYLGKFLDLVGIQVELLQRSLKAEDFLGHLLKAAVGIVQHWDHLLLTTETATRHQPANQLPLSGHFQTLNCEGKKKIKKKRKEKREGIFESSLKVGTCAHHIASSCHGDFSWSMTNKYRIWWVTLSQNLKNTNLKMGNLKIVVFTWLSIKTTLIFGISSSAEASSMDRHRAVTL